MDELGPVVDMVVVVGTAVEVVTVVDWVVLVAVLSVLDGEPPYSCVMAYQIGPNWRRTRFLARKGLQLQRQVTIATR